MSTEPEMRHGEPAIYPCADCGVMRTKSEGGTTFTVCDECWSKHYGRATDPKGAEGGPKDGTRAEPDPIEERGTPNTLSVSSLIDAGDAMEPVAWMSTGRTGGFMNAHDKRWHELSENENLRKVAKLYTIPLYERPAKTSVVQPKGPTIDQK